MSTPSMRLSDLQRSFTDTDVRDALEKAFALGHEFGLYRAANVMADSANRIRNLEVVIPTLPRVVSE